MAHDGLALRRRRERLGLSLDQVSEGTKVPVDYLHALEANELYRIPAGPYADRYAAAMDLLLSRYATHGASALGTPSRPPEASEPASLPNVDGEDVGPASEVVVHTRPVPDEEAPPERRLSLRMVQRIAFASMALAAVLMFWETAFRWQPWRGVAATAPDSIIVRVRVRENARLAVRVDGLLVEDRVFAGREEGTWSGQRRVELDVPRLDLVTLSFNGRTVEPRGEQELPRTLTFVDDAGGQ